MKTQTSQRAKKRMRRQIKRQRKAQASVSRVSIWLTIGFVIVLLGVPFLLVFQPTQKHEATVLEPEPPISTLDQQLIVNGILYYPSNESVEFYQQFWETELQPLFEQVFFGSMAEYPEVGQRIHAITERVVQRHGTQIAIRQDVIGDPVSPEIISGFASRVELGVPEIIVSIRYLHSLYLFAHDRFPDDWKSLILIEMSIILYHELEHLAHAPWPTPNSTDLFIEEELRAWGNTCANVIDPIARDQRYPMNPGSLEFWDAWVADGRTIGDNLRRHVTDVYTSETRASSGAFFLDKIFYSDTLKVINKAVCKYAPSLKNKNQICSLLILV